MARQRKIIAVDCETDPFLNGRVPEPFIWGAYDGLDFTTYDNARDMLDDLSHRHVYIFAHNGGKFDFMFLLQYIEQTRARIIKSRIVEFKINNALFRDSWSIIPIALREYRKDEIEYWKLERQHRKAHRNEILRYLETDCVSLFELVSRYFTSVGRRPTIASNALTFARGQRINVGRTNRHFDNKFRPYYYGGRCEVFQPGEFNNVNTFDIVSAYPYAMVHDHATGNEFTTATSFKGLSDSQIQRSFIDVTCVSNGAFPVVAKHGLSFPNILGRFQVTGWEFLAAKKHHLIRHDRINAIHTFIKSIHFKPYINHWFKVKQDGKENGNKADYIIGKIMMNSLYGKLSQNPIHYCDYKIYPAGTDIDLENGWHLDKCFGELELHARDALWSIKKRLGDEWEKYPIHYNVATGASITGFTRAYLLDAMHTVGIDQIIYCDTDCIFATKDADTFSLRQDGDLGAWEWEGMASPCIVAGKKLYALHYINGPASAKKDPIKIRAKGAPEQKVKIDDIRTLVNNMDNPDFTIPFSFDAPTFSVGQNPQFLVRRLRATARITS